MQDLVEELASYHQQMKGSGFWEKNRGLQRLSWLEDQIQELLGRAFLNHVAVMETLERKKPSVQSGILSPSMLAHQVLDLFLNSKK
jgi:putative protein kinase ArgK-like GTPase of G3E family